MPTDLVLPHTSTQFYSHIFLHHMKYLRLIFSMIIVVFRSHTLNYCDALSPSVCCDLHFLYRTLILVTKCFRNLQSLSLSSTWRYLKLSIFLYYLNAPSVSVYIDYLIIFYRPDIQMALHWRLFLFILQLSIC
jgi:hypothetical protein